MLKKLMLIISRLSTILFVKMHQHIIHSILMLKQESLIMEQHIRDLAINHVGQEDRLGLFWESHYMKESYREAMIKRSGNLFLNILLIKFLKT